MRAERLGSYSIATTRAGTPCLSRLKSMMRYARLAPPPRNRLETCPRLLRPPVRDLPSTSDFSGGFFEISSRVTTVMNRRDFVTGLYALIGILYLRVLRHFLARAQPHVRLFPIRAVAGETAAPPQLAFEIARAHFGDLHFEHVLDRGLDLRFIGARRDFEAQRRLTFLLVDGLFGHDRPLDYVVNRHFFSASASFCAAPSLTRTALARSRS